MWDGSTGVGGTWGYWTTFFPGYLYSNFLGFFTPTRSRKGIPRPLVDPARVHERLETSLGTLAAFNLELL